MQFRSIFRILGILLMMFSTAMLPPVGVALLYHDGDVGPFLLTFAITLITGFLLWLPCRKQFKDLVNRDGFIIVVLFWIVLTLFGSIPFLMTPLIGVSVTDAIFESVSGLTATGANAFAGLNTLSHAMLYYRQQLHFLGGMGIVVLAVAILPMLGIGGMQLYRAETPGPIKDAKLTPRLTETAKALWYIYVGLTVSCIVAFHTGGMPWFESVGEAFSVVSTGGLSIHDSSFTYYNNVRLDIIAIVFMILGGTNFALHYQFLRHGQIKVYWNDIEFRSFIYIQFFAAILVITALWKSHFYTGFGETTIKSLFTVVSMSTTTGLLNTDFSQWPTFLPILIIFLAVIGGCAASTSGGLKVVRVLIIFKQAARELKRLIHPKAVVPIKLDEHVVSDTVIQSVWGFISIFILLFVILFLLLMATGLDGLTSFSSLAVCFSNAGAGLGMTSQDFDSINDASKWILIFAMLAGRLEIFSLLILFSPAFWRD